MNEFEFRWEDRVQKLLTIKASNIEEAKQKFFNGDYNAQDIDYDDCDFLGGEIEIDGTLHEL